jgi:hypothetical protein
MERPHTDRQWFIVSRWQEYEAERRANLLRVVGIAAFYLVHMASYYEWFGLPAIPGVDRRFHQAVTSLAVAWVALALAIRVALDHGLFPRLMKFATTFADVVLLTLVVGIGDGPRSPLVVGYFLILAVATLRFSLSLVRCTTMGIVIAYLALLADARWFATRDKTVPAHDQLIVLVAMGLAGLTLGAVVRRVRRMAFEFAERASATE